MRPGYSPVCDRKKFPGHNPLSPYQEHMVTAEPGLPDTLRDLPVWTPDPAELADLELLLNGAYAPLSGFMGAFGAATVSAGGRLADGTPWPAAVTLTVPKDLV